MLRVIRGGPLKRGGSIEVTLGRVTLACNRSVCGKWHKPGQEEAKRFDSYSIQTSNGRARWLFLDKWSVGYVRRLPPRIRA